MSLRINLSELTTFACLACLALAACVGPEPKPKSSSVYVAGKGGKSGSGAQGAGTGGGGHPAAGDDTDDLGGAGGEPGRAGASGKPPSAGASGSAARGGAGVGGPSRSNGGGGTAGPTPPEAQCLPCSTNADCGDGEECNKLWCTSPCSTDIACGVSPKGASNRCLTTLNDNHICFPGCKVASDCSPYAGTTCQQPISGGGLVCSKTSATGYPCNTSLDCDAQLTCIDKLWCSPASCTGSADCGRSPAGKNNMCVSLKSGDTVCVPGCTSDDDCSQYFPDTTCQPLPDKSGTVCLTGSTVITTNCTADSDCPTGSDCIGSVSSPGWCSPPCTTNADCGTSASGHANRCVENGAMVKICFPGCAADADCADFADVSCVASGICSSS